MSNLELGQYAFAPAGSILDVDVPCEGAVETALWSLFETLGLSCYGQPEHPNAVLPEDPRDPNATVATPLFRIRLYDWGDSEDPRNAINLQYDGENPLRLSWYKYLGRGMTMSRQVDETEIKTIVEACVASMPDGWSRGHRVWETRLKIKAVAKRRTRDNADFLVVETSKGPYVVFDARIVPLIVPGASIACMTKPARRAGQSPVILEADPDGTTD